jgi:O-antigen ligase
VILFEGLFLVVFVWFFCRKCTTDLLAWFLFFLPFHAFVKAVFLFSFSGGALFSMWKEIAVIILLVRVALKYHIYGRFNIFVSHLFLILVILFFLFYTNNISGAFPSLRDHIFPILFFYAVSSIPLRAIDLQKISKYILLSVLLSAILGFVQYFYLNLPIAILMKNVASISPSGYIYYSTSSFRILGLERMSGIIGSPNLFGIFFGLATIFSGYAFLDKRLNKFLDLNRLFLLVVFIAATFCLVLSFSRAGWIIAFVGFAILFFYSPFSVKMKFLRIIGVFSICLIIIVFVFFPFVVDIFVGSLTGKEASAANRGDNFIFALSKVIQEPLGHGLGTADNRNDSMLFFAESAFMNVAFEIGILGLFILLIVHGLILLYVFFNRSSPFQKIALAVGFPTIIVSFVSINTFSMPFIYYWWFLLGMGINNRFKN